MIGVYEVLTEALPRDMRWELGVLRPLTTSNPNLPRDYDPEAARLTKSGKPRKEIWAEEGMERLGYDDLVNAVKKLRTELDYGHGTAPDLDEDERTVRRDLVDEVVDRLIGVSALPRTGSTVDIDGTGQWAWTLGTAGGRKKAVDKLKAGKDQHPSEDGAPTLEVTNIEPDEDGATAPADQDV
jgi:hypothetical protein